MRHQLGLLSGPGMLAYSLEALSASETRDRDTSPLRDPIYFPPVLPELSAIGVCSRHRALSRVAARTTPTTSCSARHALSSYGIDFTHTLTSLTSTSGPDDRTRGASRPEIRANFSVRAARLILSNTPASVFLGDAGGYANATLRSTSVRNSTLRDSRIRNSGGRLRNTTALDTHVTQRLLNRLPSAERSPPGRNGREPVGSSLWTTRRDLDVSNGTPRGQTAF